MPVSNVRLGETYAYKDGQGNTKKYTNWHNLSFYGDLADLAVTYEKGDNLFVEGSIEQHKCTPAKDGVQRTVHEVIVRNCHLVAAPRGALARRWNQTRVQSFTRRTERPNMNRGQSDSFRRLIRGCLVAISACVCLFQLCGWLGLRLNVSPSLPVGVYIASDSGRLVEFCSVEPYAGMAITRGYRTPGTCSDGGAPLLKPVVATTGDVVDVSAAGITVNGVHVPNTAPMPADTKGRPLAHWPFGRYAVSAGMVWVASSYNSRSFDSRYFGPVSGIAIRNRVRSVLCF